MINVMCYIIILSNTPQGLYRDYVQVRGVEIKDVDDKLYVDFSEAFKKMRVDRHLQADVQWVNDNVCLYK